jgi:hypothetical protein
MHRFGCLSPMSLPTGITTVHTTGSVGCIARLLLSCTDGRPNRGVFLSLGGRFVHLHGTKRVLLAPPASHHDMRLFPSIHPSYHQSQWDPRLYAVVFANVTAHTGRDSALSALLPEVMSVVLHPGEVLYIPRALMFRAHCVGHSCGSTSFCVGFCSVLVSHRHCAQYVPVTQCR